MLMIILLVIAIAGIIAYARIILQLDRIEIQHQRLLVFVARFCNTTPERLRQELDHVDQYI